jgi:hypothetical protein
LQKNKLIALMVIILLASSTLTILGEVAQAAPLLQFTGSISAENPGVSQHTTYTISITNTGQAKLGSAKVTVPNDYSDITNLLMITYPAGQTWTIYLSEGNIYLYGTAEGLRPGDTLVFIFEATNPSVDGYYAWIIGGQQNTGAGGLEFPEFELTINFLITPNLYISTTSVTTLEAGSTITADAVLEDATTDASGTVTYRLYSGTYPDGVLIDTYTVTVTNGDVPSFPEYTLTTAGSYYITATYSGDSKNSPATGYDQDTNDQFISFIVTYSELHHFNFDNISSPQTIGTPFSITVTAQDEYGNTITSYTGTPQLTYSAGAITPTTMAAFISGIGTTSVSVTSTSSAATITATDNTITGTSNQFIVNLSYDIESIAITPKTSTITAGQTEIYTVTAFDQFGNDWDITSSTTFAISTDADGSWAHNVYTSEKAGTWTVTATYSSQIAEATLIVTPATVYEFIFDTINSQIAGKSFTITITAKDQYGNIATSYTGTNTLIDSTGTINPTSTTAFTAGIWSGAVTITSPNSAITISTEDASTNTGTSNAFAVSQYTITATAGDNGMISPSGTVPVNYGSSQEFTFTPNTGYHIADVTVNDVSVLSSVVDSKYTISDITGDNTIHVTFALNAYTIIASASSGGSISPSGIITVNHGESRTFTITPNSGFDIADVKINGVSIGPVTSYTFTDIEASQSISASFGINLFTITVTQGSHGVITPGTTTVSYGSSRTFAIVPNAGYHIVDVSVDGESKGSVTSWTFSNVQKDHTLTATFAINQYTITATAGANGVITPSGTITVNYGTSQTFTISPNSGYNIADVKVDGVSVGAVTSYSFTDIAANHEIVATFTTNQYTITASAGSGGSINPSGIVVVNHGASQTFTITPSSGYRISSIIVNGSLVTTTNSYIMTGITGDSTIAVTFAAISTPPEPPATIKTYTITVAQVAHGTITPGTTTLNAGASQTFTITADAGYTIVDVIVNGHSQGSITSYSFTNVQSSQTITAVFAINQYTIIATASSNGTITPSGTITINHGESLIFRMAPDRTYNILDVTVDGVSVGAVEEYEFTNVTGNHTIEVTFAPNPISLWWILLIIILLALLTMILLLAKKRKKKTKPETS